MEKESIKKDTIYFMPQTLHCTICGTECGSPYAIIFGNVTCPVGHVNSPNSFGKQFGVITNVRT